MKSNVLAASLIFNILLLAGLSAALGTRRPTADIVQPVTRDTSSPRANGRLSIPEAETNVQSWTDRLHAAGISDRLIAAVAAADFEDQWENRLRALRRHVESGDAPADAEAQLNLQHAHEEEIEMRAILGDEKFKQWDRQKVLADFDLDRLNLSESETDDLYRLQKKLAQDRRDLELAHIDGDMDEADFSAKQAQQQEKYEQQLKTLLGPERYAAARAVPDETVANLKRDMKDLGIDSASTETLLQAQRQWDKRRAELDQHPDAADYAEQVQALTTERDQKYRQVLGAEGFAQLQKEEDSDYQNLKHYAAAWQLTDDDIDNIYQALRSYRNDVSNYQQRAEALERQGQSVDWDAVQSNIQQFSVQIQQSLQGFLGADRFRKLSRDEIFTLN